MKDVFMQKVTQIPSCLTDSAEASLKLLVKVSESSLTQSEGYRQVCRSAKLVGLSIAMSAAGMVFSHQATATTGSPQAALADLANNLEHSDTNANASTPESTANNSAQSQLQAPTLKYEPQNNDSSLKAKKEFSSQYAAIAATKPTTSEQKLNNPPIIEFPAIDSPTANSTILTPQSVAAASSARNTNDSSQPNSSLIPVRLHFQAQQLKSIERSAIKVASAKTSTKTNTIPETMVVADVADVSQPLQVIPPQDNSPALPSVSNTTNNGTVISPKPVTIAAGTFDTPIPIIVPPPETQFQPSPNKALSVELKSPIPLSVNPVSAPLPKKQENSPSSQSLAIAKLENIGTVPTFPQNSNKGDAPITIPVPAPETASLPNYSQPRNNLSPLSPNDPALIQSPSTKQTSNAQSSNATNGLATYTIQPGDTINSIAQQYNLSSTDLIKANQLSDPNLIQVNQNLLIPSLQKENTAKTTVSPQLIARNTSDNDSSAVAAPVVLAAPKISATTAEQPTKTIPIAVDAPSSTYTAQLKSDIANLQQSYPIPSRSLNVPVVPAASHQERLEEEVNPEWNQQRVAPTSTVSNRSLPRTYNTPPASLPQLQQQYRPSVRPVGVNQPQQIIGAAPIDVEEYNDSFHSPIGQDVAPNPSNQLTEGYIWPARGVFTSGYGRRWGRMHRGIDIAAPIGTPIMAAASGEVINAGWNSGGYGNLVKIRHVDGSVTLYAHNSRILVRTGQIVAQGQQISEMGSTGRSTGPHLHFEIRPNGSTAVNPIAFLPSNRS